MWHLSFFPFQTQFSFSCLNHSGSLIREQILYSRASTGPLRWNANRLAAERGEVCWAAMSYCGFFKDMAVLMIILIPPRTSQSELSLSLTPSHSLIKRQSQATNSNKPCKFPFEMGVKLTFLEAAVFPFHDGKTTRPSCK